MIPLFHKSGVLLATNAGDPWYFTDPCNPRTRSVSAFHPPHVSSDPAGAVLCRACQKGYWVVLQYASRKLPSEERTPWEKYAASYSSQFNSEVIAEGSERRAGYGPQEIMLLYKFVKFCREKHQAVSETANWSSRSNWPAPDTENP